MTNRPPQAPLVDTPGFAARRIAADILDGVLRRARPLDEQLDGKCAHAGLADLEDRDRALVRRIVATVLRRLGSLRHVVASCLDRGLTDAPRTEIALLVGAAQILLLDVPDHAAVDLSVRLVQADRRANRHAGLVNAVLRRIARQGKERLAALDVVALDTPAWMMERWTAAYGGDTARAIALGARIRAAGVFASILVPPKVAPEESRLRLIATSEHTPAEIDLAVSIIADASRSLARAILP